MTSAEIVLAAQDLLAGSWGLEPEEFEAALASWLGEAEGKLERLAALRRASQARQEALEHEIARLEREVSRARRSEEFALVAARVLLEARRELGQDAKVTWTGGKAWLQKSTPKVVVEDPAAVPSEWTRQVSSVEINKPGILAALKAGQDVAGCKLEVGEHVRFG